METPRYTVIVPMRRFHSDEPALAGLRARTPAASLEILVAEGNHPARQRNAALARARGEIVVFLDNDCTPASEFWNELDASFARPDVEVAGGPALLRPEARPLEKIFHALLTHPLVVGPVSPRYGARGDFRAATQTELILCNLAARRSLFARIGLLSPQLYPNEENEWLDRAQQAGAGIYYNPRLQVYRPQRSTWSQIFKMLLRYGIGRTRQFQVSGWRFSPYQFSPLILLAPVAAVALGLRGEITFAALWLLVSVVVALTCGGGLNGWQRIVAGLVAPLIPFTYALGQLLGWPALLVERPDTDSEISLLDEKGERPVDS
jgi:succinoglycan biosynthesis protein ExoA